jgi:hypothetical protein
MTGSPALAVAVILVTMAACTGARELTTEPHPTGGVRITGPLRLADGVLTPSQPQVRATHDGGQTWRAVCEWKVPYQRPHDLPSCD